MASTRALNIKPAMLTRARTQIAAMANQRSEPMSGGHKIAT